MRKKLSALLSSAYGVGIFICLFMGGATFPAYLAAFILGGEMAAAICDFLYNVVFKILIYSGNVIILVGLADMYLKKQKALTIFEAAERDGG